MPTRPMPTAAMPLVSGHTRIIAHLGVPTESFRAPLIYNPWFAQAGIDCLVVPMGCEAADFPALLPLLFRLRNIAGALITMPHKQAVVPLLDRISPAVSICGACNAVRRDAASGELVGDMFDGEGFLRGLLRSGRTIAGQRAMVVGCGGVGAAIAASLAAAGVGSLSLSDLDAARCAALIARLRQHYPHVELSERRDPQGQQILVNATPLGMRAEDPLPFDPVLVDPAAFVGEVVLSQRQTPLLAAVRARGCATQEGLDMLFEQIPAYLDFFGFPVPDAAALRAVARLPG